MPKKSVTPGCSGCGNRRDEQIMRLGSVSPSDCKGQIGGSSNIDIFNDGPSLGLYHFEHVLHAVTSYRHPPTRRIARNVHIEIVELCKLQRTYSSEPIIGLRDIH